VLLSAAAVLTPALLTLPVVEEMGMQEVQAHSQNVDLVKI